ncbi:TPA: hypothetical protein QCJ61_003802 [Enterobacter asburiae]|nr:hypothetical protein [Enterobacter asburiae]HDR2805770.1 hypothetical protein [Enterobacter asburiae]HDR2811340.1 hypothetical protein [Enterobacter asburiae]HDR2816777.1 hypothetical protein [Enterobacter asburiae]
MALISCLTSPDGQQDVFSCLSMGQGLGGFMVLIILLVGWLVMQAIAERRRGRRAWDIKEGKPATQFGSARHAEAVLAFANRELYQVMIAEMHKALAAKGYEVMRDESRRMTIPIEDRIAISRKIFRARQWHITPRLPEPVVKDFEDAAVSDGYAGSLLSLLIRGSETEGWYITRSIQGNVEEMEEWQKMTWPVRQVTIVITLEASAITQDLVLGIREAAKIVRSSPFPEHDSVLDSGVVPVPCRDIKVTLTRQLCCTPPGFFPRDKGETVPADLAGIIPSQQGGQKRFVVIIVQLSSRHSTELLSDQYLKSAAERIAVGEEKGAAYDHDNGYAFIVTRTKSH